MNKPLAIALAVVAVLIAAVVIWKTVGAGPSAPPPIVTGGGLGAKSVSAPPGDKPGGASGSGGLSMPSGPPGAGGGGGMTMPTPPK